MREGEGDITAQMTALRGSGVREEIKDRPQRTLPHTSAVTLDIASSPSA